MRVQRAAWVSDSDMENPRSLAGTLQVKHKPFQLIRTWMELGRTPCQRPYCKTTPAPPCQWAIMGERNPSIHGRCHAQANFHCSLMWAREGRLTRVNLYDSFRAVKRVWDKMTADASLLWLAVCKKGWKCLSLRGHDNIDAAFYRKFNNSDLHDIVCNNYVLR